MYKSILFVALPLLLLTACGVLTKRGPVDPALTAFIPSDAIALAGVRMDGLRTTPLYRKLAETNRLPRFDFDSGFDPGRDLHEILLASDGKHVLAIARGDFPAKLPSGLTTSEYRGYTLYAKDQTEVFTFIGKNIALGGPNASVREAIDQYKRGSRSAPQGLMARAQDLAPDVQIWAVVSGWRGATPDQLREMGNLGNLDRVLRPLEGASLTVDMRSGVHAAFTGDARTDADAKSLADSLRGLAALSRIAVTRKQPDLSKAFDALQVKQEGRVVQVNVDLAEDLAEKLIH